MIEPKYPNPFRINLAKNVESSLLRPVANVVERGVERTVLLSHLAREFDELVQQLPTAPSPEEFASLSLDALEANWSVTRGLLNNIPKEGPVIVVSNHPFGALEGVALIDLLAQVRPDFKILANHILNRASFFAPKFIAVDPFETSSSTKKNFKGISDCISLLRNGGLLATFPSGTVSHLSLRSKEVSDPEWNSNIARIAKRTGATVVPLYFHGRNSWLFQCMGLIHPLLRTALIPREFYKQKGKTLDIRIATAISPKRISSFSCPKELTDYFRLRTYLLAQDGKSSPAKTPTTPKLLEVIEPVERASLIEEIDALAESRLLHAHGKFEVYSAAASEIPNTLREIGRLREIAFRAANEGTGKSIDIDVFDNIYEHLFVWDTSQSEIVGAYRIAKADKILAKYGIRGLYTFSLFSYKESLIRQLDKSLEVGRSFVNIKYQRDYKALLRLWEGIGRYVGKNPEYKTLFGPVSISSEYNAVSRQLIVDFLQLNHFGVNIAREVKARTPMIPFRLRGVSKKHVRVVKRLEDVNEIVREVESRQSGLPVLLRHYLKLGAQVIGYNIDPDFSNVLDALIYVDLRDTEPKLLARYLGTNEYERFSKYHNNQQTNVASSGTQGNTKTKDDS